MVSFEVRRTRQIAIGLMLVAWPGIAPSQPASTTEEQRRIVSERIEQARAQGGPYSKELIDPLTSLAEIYRDSGNHDLAAAVTEQALQVIRANYGLRSLDQAPLIRERIQSEENRGNDAEAWDLEQALLTLARANPDDLRVARIFAEIGDKRMDLLRRYNAGDFLP
jgi:tetratricopeptide (TPR) repeat protein